MTKYADPRAEPPFPPEDDDGAWLGWVILATLFALCLLAAGSAL